MVRLTREWKIVIGRKIMVKRKIVIGRKKTVSRKIATKHNKSNREQVKNQGRKKNQRADEESTIFLLTKTNLYDIVKIIKKSTGTKIDNYKQISFFRRQKSGGIRTY